MNREQPLPQKWAIIGAGMLGLRLAQRLAQAGQRVTIYEAAPSIGGLAGAWQLGDVTWDKFYHVTLLSDLRLRELLRELDVEQDMQWVETKTGFYTDGKLYSLSNGLEFLRFPPLGLINKFRLGATILRGSKIRDGLPLEQILVGDWLRKWSGKKTFEKIWEPLLLAKLGESYRRTSAAFIWATIARMYRARQSGLKKEMFGYLPGGYARVLERFTRMLTSAGVEIRTGSPVDEIQSIADGVQVSSLGTTDEFDHVVFTTPASHVIQACDGMPPSQRVKHEAIEYLGVACASVLLKKPLAKYYVTNITDRPCPFTAVIEMTALVNPTELGGKHLVYLPRYAAADDPIWNQSDAGIQEEFILTLERMYPQFERTDVLAFQVARAKQVMALPTLNYTSKLPNLATGVRHVWAINSAHITKGTLNVNEVLELADHAFQTELLPQLTTASQRPAAHESRYVAAAR